MIFWTPFEVGAQQPDFSYLEYKEERPLARRKREPRFKSGSDFSFTIHAMCIALCLHAAAFQNPKFEGLLYPSFRIPHSTLRTPHFRGHPISPSPCLRAEALRRASVSPRPAIDLLRFSFTISYEQSAIHLLIPDSRFLLSAYCYLL